MGSMRRNSENVSSGSGRYVFASIGDLTKQWREI